MIIALAVVLLAQPLSPADAAAGWRDLSGTDTTQVWRGYKSPAFPTKGWSHRDGILSISKGGGGGDIITNDTFGDFELSWRFKMGEKANSGVMFRVAETDGPTYMTGPEYQLLEDATYGAKPADPHSCGALYDLYPPAEGKVLKPAGEWNIGRIYLRNGLLQHWLNGTKVVEARIADDAGSPTPEWTARIAASKFKDAKGFGVLPRGHIAIQDHGDTDLALRDIRVRDLASPLPDETRLLPQNELGRWVAIVPDLKDTPHVSAAAAITSVKDGVLVIKGQPIGYIRTVDTYTNFVLRLEWRFDPAKGAGNSGVLLRMVGEDKVWPKSVEAQLHSGNAGDFWNIDNFTMTTDPSRTKGRNTKKTHGAERPLGEWNEYEIIADHGTIILKVNGEELNRATGVEEVPGHICLQSEGAEIHFRNIRIAPIK